jgi:hypothetical protein
MDIVAKAVDDVSDALMGVSSSDGGAAPGAGTGAGVGGAGAGGRSLSVNTGAAAVVAAHGAGGQCAMIEDLQQGRSFNVLDTYGVNTHSKILTLDNPVLAHMFGDKYVHSTWYQFKIVFVRQARLMARNKQVRCFVCCCCWCC